MARESPAHFLSNSASQAWVSLRPAWKNSSSRSQWTTTIAISVMASTRRRRCRTSLRSRCVDNAAARPWGSAMAALDPADVLIELWSDAGLDDAALEDVAFTGSEPVLPSSFAVGTAAQATIAASALAAAELWRLRGGRRQRVGVDMRQAAIAFRSEHYLRIDGRKPDEYHDDLAALYRCGDGRWVRLHTNLPHHCSGLLKLLGVPHDKAAVQ